MNVSETEFLNTFDITREADDLMQTAKITGILYGAAVCLYLVVMLFIFWTPVMKPWVQERKGMANLAQARYENQIQQEQALAESEAALLRAEAITIVGQVAKEFPEYREQEFIGAVGNALLQGTMNQTLYIATRNGLPILPSMPN